MRSGLVEEAAVLFFGSRFTVMVVLLYHPVRVFELATEIKKGIPLEVL